MFGLSSEKIIILLVIAAIVLGPERLPGYAKSLANMVKKVRKFASEAKTQIESETGQNMDDVDWRKLDPRQYDPRRIIREALLDDEVSTRPSSGLKPRAEAVAAASLAAENQNAKASKRIKKDEPAPFDNEAT